MKDIECLIRAYEDAVGESDTEIGQDAMKELEKYYSIVEAIDEWMSFREDKASDYALVYFVDKKIIPRRKKLDA